MAPSMNKDFWLSCGHHLLDREAGGGLVATDEFLKVYLARPELTPPPEACIAERRLHTALLAEPRRAVDVRHGRVRRQPAERAGHGDRTGGPVEHHLNVS